MLVILHTTAVFLLLIPLEYILFRKKIHVSTIQKHELSIVDGITMKNGKFFPIKRLFHNHTGIKCVHAHYYESYFITSNLILEIENE